MQRNATVRRPRPARRRSGLLIVVMLCVACEPVLPDGPAGSSDLPLEERVAELVNDYRRSIGCRPLVWDPDLARVAQAHSEDMHARDYFSHTTPEGKDLADRLNDAGIRYRLAAENIAMGFRYEDAARAVVRGWLESEGHREIIRNCDFTSHGVGFAEYRWTHVFIR